MGRHKIIEDDDLLAKARDIFVKEGINVSSRKIAAEIGISNSVLFQRFGSKEELFFAAMTPPAPDMSSILEKARRGNALAHLEQISLGLLEYFRRLVPVLVSLATHPSFRFETFRKRHPNSPLEKLTIDLMTALEDKRKNGEIDCPEVGTLVLHLQAVAHTIAMFEWIGVHDGTFHPDIVRNLTRLLWRGVAPAKQREVSRKRKSRPPTE